MRINLASLQVGTSSSLFRVVMADAEGEDVAGVSNNRRKSEGQTGGKGVEVLYARKKDEVEVEVEQKWKLFCSIECEDAPGAVQLLSLFRKYIVPT